MIWRKSILKGKTQGYLSAVSVLLLFVSIYLGSVSLFSVGVLIGISLLLSSKYLNISSESIHYHNEKRTYRMFAEDEEKWQLKVTNKSRFPVIHTNVHFQMNSVVTIDKIKPTAEWKGFNEYTLPLVFQPNETKTLQIPVKGQKRGVAKLSKFELQFSDVFNFEQVKLLNDRLVKTEFIVYPSLLPVEGVDQIVRFNQGERPSQASLYE